MNNRGMSLMEVVLASAIVGILLFGWMAFEASSRREVRRTAAALRLQRVLLVIQADILKDDRFMRARGVIPELDSADFSDEDLEKSFENSADVSERCYSDGGVHLPDVTASDPLCAFYVRFYKMRVRDRGFSPTSELSFIPISRVNIRMTYVPDLNQQPMTRYFSRLVTHVATY